MLNKFLPIPNEHERNDAHPPLHPTPWDSRAGERARARRQAFAIFNDLRMKFDASKISESAFWCWSLASQNLDILGSRSQFEIVNWVKLAARLDAARRDATLFEQLVKEVKQQGHCTVQRLNNDGSIKQVYAGLFDKSIPDRCQKHADAAGCTVQLVAFGEEYIYRPEKFKVDDVDMPPISDKHVTQHRDNHLYVDKRGNINEGRK